MKRPGKVIDIRPILDARRAAEEFMKGRTIVPWPCHLYEPPEGWRPEVLPVIARIKAAWDAHVDAVIERQKKQNGHADGEAGT